MYKSIAIAFLLCGPVSAQVMRQNGAGALTGQSLTPATVTASTVTINGDTNTACLAIGSTFTVNCQTGVTTVATLATAVINPTGNLVVTAPINNGIYLRPSGVGYLQVDTGSGLIVSGGSGKVGIGTTAPATKLHMSSGTITIDGNISPSISAIDSVGIGVFTTAQLQAKTPTKLGQLVYNSSANEVCVSTGTSAAGSWEIVGNTVLTACQ